MSALRTATLSGDARSRGRRHGELFGERVRKSGILPYYLGYCARLLAKPNAAASLAFGALHSLSARGHSEEARGLIAGFAEASGIAERDVSQALVMPDVLNYLVGLSGVFQPLAALACTSVAAWGDYTRGGRFLYGRNLDFAGNGYWDQHPLLLRHKPERGIPYVSLTTAGGLIDGITAVNEEGLTVALHQHLSRDVSLWGARPVLDLSLQILQTARTIEEAVAQAAAWHTSSAWTIVLTHWKRRLACAVERTASRCFVTYARDGVFVRTNDFVEPALRETEIDYTVWRQSSVLREKRSREMLEQGRGSVDAAAVASLLRDHWDGERGRERAFAQTIASPSNMTSVVLDPEAGVLWAAEGPAPVCEGAYRKVALWEDSAPGEELSGMAPGLEASRARGYARYLEALEAWDRRDEAACGRGLAAAVAEDPEDPAYRYMAGLMLLRAGDARGALEQLGEGAAQPDLPHRQRAQRLWQARCLDVLGRRPEALRHYEAVAAEESPRRPLATAAARGSRAPYLLRKAQDAVADFFFGDVYAY